MIRLLLVLLAFTACTSNKQNAKDIQWQGELSTKTFKQAKEEDKLILLILEANWCHWCHVMEDSTYTNADVKELLNEKFICVKLDQDAHPELAARYRKYGWPATIVLNAKGEDVLKKAGYMSPGKYIEVLEGALIGKSRIAPARPDLSKVSSTSLEKRLKRNFTKLLDYKNGGFTTSLRYLEEESMEYALQADAGVSERDWFEKSIRSAYNLCDPAWGGVYQYSARNDWEHPHFEKLLHIQARYMRLFLNDYAFNGNEESLKMAEEIKGYCDRFLRQPNGLYANAQDADLKKGEKASAYFELTAQERLKRGIPAIDTHTYTHSNADYARALLRFSSVTKNKESVKNYNRIVEQLLKRKTEKGLYAHSDKTKKIDALRDNVAMAQLFVEHMKRFPDDTRIAREMEILADAIVNHFRLPNGTFQGFSGELGLVPEANIEENIPLARFFNWFAAFSGNKQYAKHAASVVDFLLKSDASKPFYHEPGISMLLMEVLQEATGHVSVKEDAEHALLVEAYIFAPYFSTFQTLEGASAEKKEQFSGINDPSVFICTSSYCSSPLKNREAVANFYR